MARGLATLLWAGWLLQAALARLPWLHASGNNASGVELLATSYEKELPCKNLVKRAPVKFPQELMLGVERDFSMHSGYVNVTSEDHLFYWLVEAAHTARDDAPLIVWSNGGPGCSGMEGATTESGPYILRDVKESSRMFTGKLAHNEYSWNTRAHVLYVDQPRYVGFSCGTGPRVTSSREAGKDMVQFLLGWRQLFPEHRHRDVIFASESYGGHYVPAWTAATMDYNERASEPIPLKGIALGNAIVDYKVQGLETFTKFLKSHALIKEDEHPRTDTEARDLMAQHLGYQPNFYNFGLVDVECCGCYSYNYSTWGHWLMKKEVTEALNVCGDAGANTFGGCRGGCMASMEDFDSHDTFDYRGALERALDHGIKVTMFYGMMDTACDYVGGFTLANALQWRGAHNFKKAPLVPLHLGGSHAGESQSAHGLTWVQIKGAGHMVEVDNPAASSYAIDTLILEVSRPSASLYMVARQLIAGVPGGQEDWPLGVPQQLWVSLALAASALFAAGVLAGQRCRPHSEPWDGDDYYVRVDA